MVTITRSKAKNAGWADGVVTTVAHMAYTGWLCAYDKITIWTRSQAHFTRPERNAPSDELEIASRWNPARQNELDEALEEWDNEGGSIPLAPPGARRPGGQFAGYPRYFNDIGARAIRIGATEFHCIGASPPQDHPHIYLNMEGKPQILCPYCSTCYIYDARLQPDETEPANCFYRPPGG